MIDFMNWQSRARFVLDREKTNPSVLMVGVYCNLPRGVLYEVIENTAAFLKEKHSDVYGVFVDKIDSAYRRELESIAEETARTSPGDPDALIRFPGKGA